MNIKGISAIIVLFLVLGSLGSTFAVDQLQLTGMDTDKSIGNIGVMTFNDTTQKGLCTDKGQTIYFGEVVTVTPGTSGVDNSNSVKKLIVQNYRENMTEQDGYNLQQAIWYFTDGVSPVNSQVQDMIDGANDDASLIPDSGYTVLVNQSTILVATETKETIELLDTKTTSVDNITLLGTTESIERIVGDECVKVITTITSVFSNETTLTTVNTYLKTTIITDTYQTIKNYLEFDFNSFVSRYRQDIIIFSATPSQEVTTFNEVEQIPETFSNETVEKTTKTFEEVVVKSICDPIIPEKNETVEPFKTIPMETTGANPGLLFLALGLVSTGIGGALRFKR